MTLGRDGLRARAAMAAVLVAVVAAAVVVVMRIRSRGPQVTQHRISAHPVGARLAPPVPSFVGAQTCGGCHPKELGLWLGSHHQLAMQPATQASVLGDFNNAKFNELGVTSIFFRRGGAFMVRTGGADGRTHDYEIEYTFGVYPLQQYLIPLSGGRVQAFGIAWDARPRASGGQRWLSLYPGEKLAAGDPLHWTGIDQNWNFMCADCHSTNLRKSYDSRTRTFHTVYAAIDVACEACHGPGSNHVAWARHASGGAHNPAQGLTISLDAHRDGLAGAHGWVIDSATGNARWTGVHRSDREIQMCARCHSRRGEIHEDFVHGQPIGDDYRVALLEDDLYFADGQIKGEVYEYGSFIQSRMHHAGVTCSDCHEPHSLRLRAEGNGVCLQCHAAHKYDTPKHHFHPMGSAGARCVQCHMPARTYMVVDRRRDHSLRIPRPDLSVKLGVPNACTNCHSEKTDGWAAAAVAKWYGHAPAGFQRFAAALDAGLSGAPGAARALADLAASRDQPSIARATALARLASYPGQIADEAARGGAGDASALVRRASARALSDAAPEARASILAPLLGDRVRAVRIEAAQALAGAPENLLSAAGRAAFTSASAEYVAAQNLNGDRPEAHLDLALLAEAGGDSAGAESELKLALAIDPAFAPAAVDLADLYRQTGRDADGARVLREAIARSPASAPLQHAIGLLLVRQGKSWQALSHLAAASRLDPGNARFAYVYAIALNDGGDSRQAIGVLETALKHHPYDRDALAALASIYAGAGHPRQAVAYASRLVELEPDDPRARQLLNQCRAQASKSD